MKTIAFFNNKGGVGKTTLIYHLAWMFSEMGLNVIAADYDPQANFTALSLTEAQIDAVEDDEFPSIYDVIAPLIADGEKVSPPVVDIRGAFHLIPGDLRLSAIEDALSSEWTKCLADTLIDRKRAFRVTTCLARAIQEAGDAIEADVALIDVGPNLGAINRCALLGADYVIVPVAPDIFSLQGLTNVGEGLRDWRQGWSRRLEMAPEEKNIEWPEGMMLPAGYVISRFSTYAGEKAAHFRRWINRVPQKFHDDVMNGSKNNSPKTVDDDDNCLAWLKDYRSLIPMAHEVKRPIFKLRPADGAIGAHFQAVKNAYLDFRTLAQRIADRAELPVDANDGDWD